MSEKLGKHFDSVFRPFVVGNLGDGLSIILAPIIAASISPNALDIGLVGTCRSLPWLFSLFNGTIIDLVNRKRLIIICNTIRFISFLAVAILLYQGGLTIPLLCLFSFTTGYAETFYDNTVYAVIKDTIEEKQRNKANSKLVFYEKFMNWFLGRLGGTLIADFFSVVASAFIIPITYLISTILCLNISYNKYEKASVSSIRDVFKETALGFKHAFSNSNLVRFALVGSISNMALCGVDPSLLLFLKDLGVLNTKFAYGVIFTGTGIGLTISAYFAPKIISALTASRAYSIAVFGYSPMFFVTYFYPHPVLIFLVFFAVGFSSGVMSVITMGFRQKLFDSAVQGRVTTVLRWILWGSIPFGQFFGGYLAEAYGYKSVYLIFGSAMFVAFLIWMTSTNKEEINSI